MLYVGDDGVAVALKTAKVKMADDRGFGFAVIETNGDGKPGRDVYFHASAFAEPKPAVSADKVPGIKLITQGGWKKPAVGSRLVVVLSDRVNKKGNPEACLWAERVECEAVFEGQFQEWRLTRKYDVRLHPVANNARMTWEYPVQAIAEPAGQWVGLDSGQRGYVLSRRELTLSASDKWPEQTVTLSYKLERRDTRKPDSPWEEVPIDGE